MSDIKRLQFDVQISQGKNQLCQAYFPNIGEFCLPGRLPTDLEAFLARTISTRLQAVPWEKEAFPITFLGNPWLDMEQAPILMAISPSDDRYDEVRSKAEQAMNQPVAHMRITVTYTYMRVDLATLLDLFERWGYDVF